MLYVHFASSAQVKKLPSALEWFNRRLAISIFPAAAAYFPEIVSSAAQLRAHSVSITSSNLAAESPEIMSSAGQLNAPSVSMHAVHP